MEKHIQVFNNTEFGEIRTMEINGEPWFVGKDIATALGYAKPENAVSNHVDSEDKTSTLIQGNGIMCIASRCFVGVGRQEVFERFGGGFVG